jgi:ABC-2 type transport system permease protein
VRSSLSRTIRALPALLRIGVAETVAYRAEFIVWMLTSTMPLINLALWTSVADEAPFQQYESQDFVAYFLGALIVRNLTGNWVAWQIMEEIRIGILSMRLLRPVHPFVAYGATHIAALPFRSLLAVPLAVILLISSGASALTTDPVQLVLLVPSLLLAWLITFGIFFALGCLGFWMTQAFGVMNFYFAVWSLLSGYLLPLDLLPAPIATAARWMPFHSMLGAPIELMTKHLSTSGALEIVARQAGWAAACVAASLLVWRAGVRRFEAVGG